MSSSDSSPNASNSDESFAWLTYHETRSAPSVLQGLMNWTLVEPVMPANDDREWSEVESPESSLSNEVVQTSFESIGLFGMHPLPNYSQTVGDEPNVEDDEYEPLADQESMTNREGEDSTAPEVRHEPTEATHYVQQNPVALWLRRVPACPDLRQEYLDEDQAAEASGGQGANQETLPHSLPEYGEEFYVFVLDPREEIREPSQHVELSAVFVNEEEGPRLVVSRLDLLLSLLDGSGSGAANN